MPFPLAAMFLDNAYTNCEPSTATATLPPPYTVSGEIARVGGDPIALGGIFDISEGTRHGKRISIECLKVSLDGDQTLKKVRILFDMSLSRRPKNACGPCSHSSKTPLCGGD